MPRTENDKAVSPSRRGVMCTHCGLPVPAGLVDPDPAAETQFCCHGCRGAYALIQQLGLKEYYRVRECVPAIDAPIPVSPRRESFEHFDDPTFLDMYATTQTDGMSALTLVVEGMHCAACIWLIERLPRVARGVVESRVDFRRRQVRLVWDASQQSLSSIASVLDELGYTPHPASQRGRQEARRSEDRAMLIRIGVAGACAGNAMLLSVALYAGLFEGMATEFEQLFRWSSMVIGIVALAWPGQLFFRGALSALRARTLNMDVPIALGLLAGGGTGVANTVLARGEIYFDSVTALVFLLLIGRWIQHRQQRSAADAVELLFSLTPGDVRVVRDGTTRQVPLEAVECDEEIEVRPGERIPVDACITRGTTTLDLSLLSGESRPITAETGEQIFAGSINLSRTIRAHVTATGQETRVARIMQLVEEASQRKPRIVQAADRIARWFVAAVLCVAGACALAWWFIDASRISEVTTSLLIVTCPCALGLATPLAIDAALGQAARRGILIKGGDVIEALSRPARLLLDKTGTLTEGVMRVAWWQGTEEARVFAAAAEAHSMHPTAEALRRAVTAPVPEATMIEEVIGGGVRAMIRGHQVVVGSRVFVMDEGIPIPSTLAQSEHELLLQGMTPTFVCIDGEVAGLAGLGDPIREDAHRAVTELTDRGWRPGIVSGDHPEIVSLVARRLGIAPEASIGGATPEEKLAIVRESAERESTVIVGDGVNDAAAIAGATVGIAAHAGAEASLAAADVYLSRPGLGALVALTDGARRTVGVIRRNLAISLGYNVIFASLAVCGLITPLLAAVLMPISSLTVITLSYRSRTFGDPSWR